MKKIDFYGSIQGEAGVIMAFSKLHDVLGFSRLVSSTNRGFDIDSINYKGQDVTVEFEFLSSNFITHKHPEKMIDGQKYVVICWEDDCGLMTTLKYKFRKELFELIEIRGYVNIKEDFETKTEPEEPIYAILSYKQEMAGGKDFGEWAFSHCYRVKTSENNPKFGEDYLPIGSKILFYQNGFIIGGFTVVRYEIIDEPNTKREWELYKKLTDYPASLFTISIEDYKREFYRGHIFYTDFFDIRDVKIRLDQYISKQMPHQGKINISKDEYYRIIGK